MNGATVAVVVGCGLTIAGCGGRMPKPAVAADGRPQVGWVIMSGDRDSPDRDFVCQSNPRNECAMKASTANEQVFTHVHFYFHPAAADTRYDGSIRMDFLQGDYKEAKVTAVVHPGSGATNQSIEAIVANRPGSYVLKLAVDAKPANGSGAPTRIREDVKITLQ